jgi:hypothetical protein
MNQDHIIMPPLSFPHHPPGSGLEHLKVFVIVVEEEWILN